MKRSVINILFAITILLIIKANVVLAVNHSYNTSYVNSCVENHTCILLCGYTNNLKKTADIVKNPEYDKFSSYIYFDMFENSFFVEWLSQETSINSALHHQRLGHKYIFIQENVLNDFKNNGKCPSNSYIDTSGVTSEVCFSNNETYCVKNDPGGLGTTFEGESILEYNYENEMDNYFSNIKDIISDYSCYDLENGNINISNEFVNDFSKNFLYGSNIPNFMKNSNAYKSSSEMFNNEIAKLEKKCSNEVKEKYISGEISQIEYENIVKKIIEESDNLITQINNSYDSIENVSNSSSNNTVESNCNDILGNPDIEGTPAWYISLMFSVIRYAAIILLIVLTVMDFFSAVASQDNDVIRKAVSKAIKRAILCVIIFVLPTLINFVLKFISDQSIQNCINVDFR